MSEQIRSLSIDGVRYGWRVTHRHQPVPSGLSQRTCVDRFMAFRKGTSGAALRIDFTEGARGGPEYVQRHGVVLVHESRMLINLHRPQTAAALIQRARELGWSAEAPMEIEDGFAFVSEPALLARIGEPLSPL